MSDRRLGMWFLPLLLASFAFVCAASAADVPSPGKPDLSAYADLPNVDMVSVSPSGEKLAYVQVTGNARRLVIQTFAGAPILAVDMGEIKVRDLHWAGEDHLLIGESTTVFLQTFDDQNEYFQTVSFNLKTGKAFGVFGTSDRIMHAVFGYNGSAEVSGHWIGYFGGVTLNKTRGFDATFNSENWVDLYAVDLDTGDAKILAPALQKDRAWVVDSKGGIVAHSEYDDKKGVWSLFSGASDEHLLLTRRDPLGENTLVGLGLSADTVTVSGKTYESVKVSDGSSVKLPFDGFVSSFSYSDPPGLLQGVYTSGDDHKQILFDPHIAARHAAFNKALGGRASLWSWSADGKRLVLHTEGDGDAGTYWLADGAKVTPWRYDYPKLPDSDVGPVRTISYTAADGLKLSGILTLPPGKAPKALPVVVIPHGGPEAHDFVRFDWLAQAFAGRGYAVFQPNFRGSSGFGPAFRDAGFGEWGRKMQTDISDGLAELARQGIVDPRRAAIVGASYGGYAALAGVTLQHGLYRCAVSYGGLSDLKVFLYWKTPDGDLKRVGTGRYLAKFFGIQSMGDPALTALSPAQNADHADAPILLIHGLDDSVVPISQSQEMQRALSKSGKPVTLVTLKGEDHWLSSATTRLAMLKAAVEFVALQNPTTPPN